MNNLIKFIYTIVIFHIVVQSIEAKKLPISENNKYSNDIKLFKYRSSNLVSNSENIITINKYTNKLLSITDKESLGNVKDVSYIFKQAISSTQFSTEELLVLRRYAIALKSHLAITNKTKRYLNDIIWWSHARTITVRRDLIQFLNSQMNIRRREDSLKMFVEHGMVKQIELWSNKLKFEKSKLKFDLAIRQAKIVNLLKKNNANLSKMLIVEIKTSIDTILPVVNKKRESLEYYHLIWFFKQLGIYHDKIIIRNILENLVKDALYYNKNTINNLSLDEQKLFFDAFDDIESIIDTGARKALNPYEILDYPNRVL